MNFSSKVRNDIGKGKASPGDMRKNSYGPKKMHLHSSKAIVDLTGVGGFCRQTRCTALNKLGKVVKPKARPHIMERNKAKRVSWATKYMKVDFSKVIFTDECRASLDGPGGWSKGWILYDESVPVQATTGGGGGGFYSG